MGNWEENSKFQNYAYNELQINHGKKSSFKLHFHALTLLLKYEIINLNKHVNIV